MCAAMFYPEVAFLCCRLVGFFSLHAVMNGLSITPPALQLQRDLGHLGWLIFGFFFSFLFFSFFFFLCSLNGK